MCIKEHLIGNQINFNHHRVEDQVKNQFLYDDAAAVICKMNNVGKSVVSMVVSALKKC